MENKYDIRKYAKQRVAKIYGINIDSLQDEFVFDVDLKVSYVSDFKFNELDVISHDIEDVSTPEMLAELRSENMSISTVDDYCNHMVKCHLFSPETVEIILGLRKDKWFYRVMEKLLGSRNPPTLRR